MKATHPQLTPINWSPTILSLPLALFPLFSCSDGNEGARGSLEVVLEAEDTIVDGLSAGDGLEQIRDGWSVTFDSYIVTIGELRLDPSDGDGSEAGDDETFIVDLTQVSRQGEALWNFEVLEAGRWDIRYSTPLASSAASRHPSVTESDYELMIADEFTYSIRGSLSKEGGVSCPPAALAMPGTRSPSETMSGDDPCYDAPTIAFALGARANVTYGPCEIDGVPGVSVPSGATQTVNLTIHGDHLFFNGFPETSEGGVTRLAQWLADCDLDLDGTVTREELEAIHIADLPEIDDRFQLGGSPRLPLVTVADYIEAQLSTQGHFQGEGECAIEVDANP